MFPLIISFDNIRQNVQVYHSPLHTQPDSIVHKGDMMAPMGGMGREGTHFGLILQNYTSI